jgi:hypothetical protein
MNSTKDITLNIQQIDERSAGLLNRTPDRKDPSLKRKEGEWLEARLGAVAGSTMGQPRRLVLQTPW